MKGIDRCRCRRGPGKVLRRLLMQSHYMVFKENHNAPRPSEHPLVKKKRGNVVSTPSSMVLCMVITYSRICIIEMAKQGVL